MYEFKRLDGDVKGDVVCAGEEGELVGTQWRNDGAVFEDGGRGDDEEGGLQLGGSEGGEGVGEFVEGEGCCRGVGVGGFLGGCDGGTRAGRGGDMCEGDVAC